MVTNLARNTMHACMVYLTRTPRQIDEANEIIEIVPLESDARVYGPLLSACKIHSETYPFSRTNVSYPLFGI